MIIPKVPVSYPPQKNTSSSNRIPLCLPPQGLENSSTRSRPTSTAQQSTGPGTPLPRSCEPTPEAASTGPTARLLDAATSCPSWSAREERAAPLEGIASRQVGSFIWFRKGNVVTLNFLSSESVLSKHVILVSSVLFHIRICSPVHKSMHWLKSYTYIRSCFK